MHLTPAGLPAAIPGKGEEIDNATQQAPQFSLQFIRQIYKEDWSLRPLQDFLRIFTENSSDEN